MPKDPNTGSTELIANAIANSSQRSCFDRLVKVRSLGINTLNFSGIPVSRLKALARHAATIRVQAIARMPFEQRIATLLAFIHTLEALAADDTLDF